MSFNKAIRDILVCTGLLGVALNASAYDLPQLNFGGTSFLDGGPPAGAGLYIGQYFQYYTGRLKDGSGRPLPLPKQDIDTFASLTQFLYVSPSKLNDTASWGINANVPVLLSAHTDDGLNGQALRTKAGLGDVQIGPFVQFDAIMGPNGPRFMHRFELDVFVPVGEYDRTKAVNPGSNFWSIDPYWAGTLWLTPRWTFSWRLHYLWNARNSSPSASYGNVQSTQAGQAVHANFATEYAVTEKLRLGLNGYWLQQISDTKVNDQDNPGSRERVWALGPGGVYSFSKEDHIFLNAYSEFSVRNRPKGTRIWARYVHHF
ncbi:hypothetical protein LMG6871_04272 [Ralstonia edaphis]|uniref:SphA family protein n=1 Tax=Ralstonia edaphi TaxID=3058599 RepID=UPI0028F58EEF|nr:transporter [Ralstonia sp. LMG 6871]CAJ0720849.1 hypothetical protein LMG6871_04272 [Ralstonia sp. LMG 6871]